MNNDLRQKFFESLLASQFPRTAGKVLLAKSAAPELLTIRDKAGNVICFGNPESVSADEAAYVSGLENPNQVFDDTLSDMLETSSSFPRTFPAVQVDDVQKSGDSADKNSVFNSLMPF